MLIRVLLTLISLTLTSALAENAPKKSSLEIQRAMSVTYGSPAWNLDSKKIDSAFLVIKDKTSGKLLQIQLEESEPDSSNFTGQFSVSLKEGQGLKPEVYIPPQELREKDPNNRSLYEMIRSGKLARKPVVWKKNERGQTMLDVYDTREQAESALKAFQAEENLKADAKKKSLLKAIPNEASLAAAQLAARNAELQRLALEAAKREADRVRLEQIERQKMLEREKAAKALSERQRAERKARAEKLAAEAMELYKQGKYSEAEPKFRESSELDPENKTYNFYYGVTLYRNDKPNEALVMLKLSTVDEKTDIERRYYMGLIHYRLKELDPSLENFTFVASKKDPVMSPSAEFYRGVILFSQENYDPAKKSFETVIDTSSDPRLDDQAEQYLDRIASALAIKKLRENRFTFTGTLGGNYDSNVLLSPDNTSDQGGQTKVSDFRILTIADLEYRAIYTERHEFGAKVDANLTNSLKNEAAIADPWIYNLSLPYAYKGVIGSKGVKFGLKPALELLYMDPYETGTKKEILQSYYVDLDTTLVMSPKWFSLYTLEYRHDDSKGVDSEGNETNTGENNADALKYSLRTSQMFFFDNAKKEGMIFNLGYIINNATGDEKKYTRIEGGFMYLKPWIWSATWNAGLSLYRLSYGSASETRNDFNWTLNTGFSKPIKEWLTWGVAATYTDNGSNISTDDYSKYVVMSTLTVTTNF